MNIGSIINLEYILNATDLIPIRYNLGKQLKLVLNNFITSIQKEMFLEEGTKV